MNTLRDNLFQIIKDSDLSVDVRIEKIKTLTKNVEFLGDILAPHGENLLHFAASENLYGLLDYLIEKGVYLNQMNFYGTTPMYYGASRKNIEIIKWFANHKANPRPISAFSGNNTSDCVELMEDEIMKKYCSDYEDKMKNPKFHYFQKTAEDCAFSMMITLHPRGTNFCPGYVVRPEIEAVKSNIQNMINICKIADSKLWHYDDNNNIDDVCIICNKETADKCKYCEDICMCSECFHDVNNIHVSACKSGFFKSHLSLRMFSKMTSVGKN